VTTKAIARDPAAKPIEVEHETNLSTCFNGNKQAGMVVLHKAGGSFKTGVVENTHSTEVDSTYQVRPSVSIHAEAETKVMLRSRFHALNDPPARR
jgi:hypothetical protein